MYANLPLSPRGLGTSRPKAKRLIAFSRRYAPKNTIRLPPKSGTADTKEKEFIVLYLYTHLCVSLAGFFVKRHMMFFLLSSFRFYPPLKNDGRGELRFGMTVNDLLPKKKRIQIESRPRTRGRWRRQPSEGASVSRYVRKFLTKRQ